MQNSVVYNKGVIELVKKPEGAKAVKVYTRPEDKIFYKFDIKNTKYRVFGNSIELIFDDNSKFVFISVIDMLEEKNPPMLVLSNGKEVSFETVVLKIADEEVYSTLIKSQSEFEDKLKALQVSLANEFKKVEQLKADLIKEKAELYEFKTNDTLTKEITQEVLEKVSQKKDEVEETKTTTTQAVLVEEPKVEKKVESSKKTEKKEKDEPKVEKKEDKKVDKVDIDAILAKDDTSKIDEIDSIIRELDIR